MNFAAVLGFRLELPIAHLPISPLSRAHLGCRAMLLPLLFEPFR